MIDQLIDKIRQRPVRQGSVLFWTDRAFPIFESAIQTALQLWERTQEAHFKEQAFAIVEKGNISLHRVEYDIDKVNELMIKAGFNDSNYRSLKKEERYYAGFHRTE